MSQPTSDQLVPVTDLLGGSTAYTVYRLLDIARRLLYVGSSKVLLHRLEAHRCVQSWWPEVAFVRVTNYPDAAEMAHAERVAIGRENPKYNRRDMPRQRSLALGPTSRMPTRQPPPRIQGGDRSVHRTPKMREIEERFGEPLDILIRRLRYDEKLTELQICRRLDVRYSTLRSWLVHFRLTHKLRALSQMARTS